MTWRMAAIAGRVEQRLGELQRAVDRGARRAPVGRARDLARDRVGRLRAFDQPPRHQDRLVEQAGPFEIGHRDLAVRAGAQRLQELARGQRGDVAVALQFLLLRDPSSSTRRPRSPARRRPARRWAACRPSRGAGAASPPLQRATSTAPPWRRRRANQPRPARASKPPCVLRMVTCAPGLNKADGAKRSFSGRQAIKLAVLPAQIGEIRAHGHRLAGRALDQLVGRELAAMPVEIVGAASRAACRTRRPRSRPGCPDAPCTAAA